MVTAQSVPLTQYEKVRILAEAVRNGGEKSLRFMAQLIGAGACPKCDYVHTHCKCPKETTSA